MNRPAQTGYDGLSSIRKANPKALRCECKRFTVTQAMHLNHICSTKPLPPGGLNPGRGQRGSSY